MEELMISSLLELIFYDFIGPIIAALLLAIMAIIGIALVLLIIYKPTKVFPPVALERASFPNVGAKLPIAPKALPAADCTAVINLFCPLGTGLAKSFLN